MVWLFDYLHLREHLDSSKHSKSFIDGYYDINKLICLNSSLQTNL